MNKIYKILMIAIIGIVILSTIGNAIPIEEWNKTFGGPGYDIFYSVNQTKDGGYILAGNKIIKTDIFGNKIWEKIFRNITFNSVKQTKDGGYILTGGEEGSIIGAIIIKTYSLGNIQWKKIYKADLFGEPSFSSVQQTKDGGYIVAGVWHVLDPLESDSGAWVIKTDSLGNKQWDNGFTYCSQGCESFNIFESVQQTKDGDYLLAGTTNSFLGSSAMIVKMDFNGNEKWNKTFEYSEEAWETIRSIAEETKDGGYIIIGGNSSYSWLIKTDSLGNKQWRKILQKLCDDTCSIDGQQTKDGGYVITGSNIIIKTDAFGNIKWSKTTKIGDNIISVQQTKDDGYILTGKNNNGDARLIKLSAEKAINVKSPNGGEKWPRGTTQTIGWKTTGGTGQYVKIELLKNGVLNKTISSSTPNDWTYNWAVPSNQTLGSNYKIRITTNYGYKDISDENFTIGGINVISPNGGDNWQRGTTHTISWKSVGIAGSVKIELLKAGILNRVISYNTSNDGYYSWTIPSTQNIGSDYKIKITSTGDSRYYDWSDNNFRIY